MHDPYDLQRFVSAQASVYDSVLDELRAGRKRSHWMWFVFPQIAGLGSSATAQRFAIRSLAEARAYMDHPLLGSRLIECVTLVNRIEARTALQIFGSPDDVKFRSSMTLFERAVDTSAPFGAALDKFFDGERDRRTLALLGLGAD